MAVGPRRHTPVAGLAGESGDFLDGTSAGTGTPGVRDDERDARLDHPGRPP